MTNRFATFCPSEHISEPALKEAYKGCSVYTYYDSNKRRQFVMLDKDYRVKYGTKEALQAKHKTGLEVKYSLELVRTVD